MTRQQDREMVLRQQAKTNFGQSRLTWLHSGDPATRLSVLGPFRFWKKSNQTDLGRGGKKVESMYQRVHLNGTHPGTTTHTS